eukprot:gene8666-11709_t
MKTVRLSKIFKEIFHLPKQHFLSTVRDSHTAIEGSSDTLRDLVERSNNRKSKDFSKDKTTEKILTDTLSSRNAVAIANIHQTIAGRKRFYNLVGITQSEETNQQIENVMKYSVASLEFIAEMYLEQMLEYETIKTKLKSGLKKGIYKIKEYNVLSEIAKASIYQSLIPVFIYGLNKRLYNITLDGKVLKTPGRLPLSLPNPIIATAIAAEWDAQTDYKKGIQPVTMPLMTLISTSIDQVSIRPDITIDNCMRYLATDSALYFTNDTDRLLLMKQKQNYLPVIKWWNRTFEIDLETTDSMSTKLLHPHEVVNKVKTLLSNMDPYTLTAVQSATYECKSLVLGLAYVCRFLSLEEVIKASRIEEEFQLEIWGVVEGGHDMDRLNNCVSLSSVGCFMSLLYDHEEFGDMMEKWKESIEDNEEDDQNDYEANSHKFQS